MWSLMFSQRQKRYKHLFEGDFLREFHITPNENRLEVHFHSNFCFEEQFILYFLQLVISSISRHFWPMQLISDLPLAKAYPAEHLFDKE